MKVELTEIEYTTISIKNSQYKSNMIYDHDLNALIMFLRQNMT